MSNQLPKCGHRHCENIADPRWMAYCVVCQQVRLTCDGHPGLGGAAPPDHPHPWNAFIIGCRWCTPKEENP